MANNLSPAEQAAIDGNWPVLRMVPFDLLRVASGHPMRIDTEQGAPTLVRLMTADELMAAHRQAVDALAEGGPLEPNLTYERAVELTRPLVTR